MAFTFFMRDQPTLEHATDHMIPIPTTGAGSGSGMSDELLGKYFEPDGYLATATGRESTNCSGAAGSSRPAIDTILETLANVRNITIVTMDAKYRFVV
jgi:hypothetical protein